MELNQEIWSDHDFWYHVYRIRFIGVKISIGTWTNTFTGRVFSFWYYTHFKKLVLTVWTLQHKVWCSIYLDNKFQTCIQVNTKLTFNNNAIINLRPIGDGFIIHWNIIKIQVFSHCLKAFHFVDDNSTVCMFSHLFKKNNSKSRF